MKHYFIVLLVLASAFANRVVAQTINISSIANARQPAGNNGYTLDGQFMTDSRAKLLEQNNFGPSGTYPKTVNITDGYSAAGSLTQVSSLPTNQIFFFGAFDQTETSLIQFSQAEIDSLYNWSKNGGKLIIGASAKYVQDYDPSVLNATWGFDLFLLSPNSLVPTAAGNNTDIFNGPFGNVPMASQGGGAQGYFTTMPANSVTLATTNDGHPTLFIDCNTLDLVIADVDCYTSQVGVITPGSGINNAQDRFWANTIAFMDRLDGPPTITKNGLDLSTGNYSSYQWYLDDSPINGAISQTYTANIPGNYSVEATLNCGCKSRSEKILVEVDSIKTYNYFLPDAFTPNADGRNDFLAIQGSGIETMDLLIYNRWGQKIFESHNPADGWDGNFKGATQPSGVFVYSLKISFYNGQKVAKKGSVTLIR